MVKNGVPWDIAFGGVRPTMDSELAQATAIIMNEFEGREFNWNTWQFKEV